MCVQKLALSLRLEFVTLCICHYCTVCMMCVYICMGSRQASHDTFACRVYAKPAEVCQKNYIVGMFCVFLNIVWSPSSTYSCACAFGCSTTAVCVCVCVLQAFKLEIVEGARRAEMMIEKWVEMSKCPFTRTPSEGESISEEASPLLTPYMNPCLLVHISRPTSKVF